MKHRFKITPAVYLILEKNKKILMARRFNTGWEDGNYSLPSGHLDGNEKAKDAMCREAKEEVGIDIEPRGLEIVHIMHRRTGDIGNERIDIYFKAEKWQGEPKNIEKDKCDDVNWFQLNRLPKNIVLPTKEAIKYYTIGTTYSEYGW